MSVGETIHQPAAPLFPRGSTRPAKPPEEPRPVDVSAEAEEAEEARKGTGMDKEILCISQVLRKLQELPPDSLSRVVAYLSARFVREP